MLRSPAIPALWLPLVVAGCNTGFDSDAGQLHFDPVDVMTSPASGMSADSPVLVGSTVCLDITSTDPRFPEGEEVGACFTRQVLGPGALDEADCVVIEGPGDVELTLDTVPCPANDAGYAPIDDSIHLRGVAASEVDAGLRWWVEESAAASLEPDEPWPKHWTSPGEPFGVLAGSTLHLPVLLNESESDADVAWVPEEATLDVIQTGSASVTFQWASPGWLDIRVPMGASADFRLALHDRSWDLGSVQAVGADDVRSLDLVAGYLPNGDAGLRVPFGARAVLRTADGQPVLGAPIEWRVTKGALALSTADLLPGPDYVTVSTDCVPPSQHVGAERARIEARWNGLVDDADLDWVTRNEPDPNWQGADPDEGWTANPECDGGCGCTATPRHGPSHQVALWVGLVGFTLRRRCRLAVPGVYKRSTVSARFYSGTTTTAVP